MIACLLFLFLGHFSTLISMFKYTGFLLLFILLSCTRPDEVRSTYTPSPNALFKRLTTEQTGIKFINALEPKEDFDVFRYRNYYNGGGVGMGDFNNDGLSDVYLTSNMGDNKLFVNKGNWKFEDITEKAGVKGSKIWSTGVSIADVNADGFLDIYVCNAGDVKGGKRENELFINNGNLTFTERAEEYGLADKGFSTHAAFFDYDKDGDLDCYVLNNSYRPISTLGYRNLRHQRDEFGGHKLYRNDEGKFIDVSEQSGIYGSVIGFGLGVTVGDVNQDSWPDLYISNDFYEFDYLYINNKKGGFDEKVQDHMGHISMFSMGADLADLNNDGYPEIFSTDMLPEDDYRLKTLIAFETYDVYQLRLKNGYYHQFMRNMLQLNNGDGTFTEIGQLAGVAATDWSWGALIADFNNDSFKDIFVCNGIYKDVINQDFVEYLGSSEQMQAAIEGKKVDYKQFVNSMPSQKISNYLFTRDGEMKYKNVSTDWGLDEPSFSNGAAYGDLDNDGDLDLIVNNVNQDLFVYKNESADRKENNYLSIVLKGKDKNLFALGTNVKAYSGNEIHTYDHMPIRGFQSSMDYKMIIGLGKVDKVDSVIVTWPDQTGQILRGVKANQTLVLSNADGKQLPSFTTHYHPLLKEIKTDSISHKENFFNDLDGNRLQYHMLSTQGPAFAKADLNGDGLDDIFIGNGVGTPGNIFIQKPGYKFVSISNEVFLPDAASEDVDAVFFDADMDGDQDLYVVSGGTETPLQSINSTDRLYENKGLKNGTPVFEKTSGKIPQQYLSGSSVKPADIDHDGDLDLFVGTRVNPLYYGMPCDQILLINDGKGNFIDMTSTIAPQLRQLGMVTDASWFDYNHDEFPDLMMVGEWMPITIFINDGKHLSKADNVPGLDKSDGWWNCVKQGDIDGDGDTDFVLGNFGLNTKFKASAESPITLYVNDFDKNGSVEPVFAYEKQGKEYPLALRQEMIKQMSSLKKKFVYYKDYANKSLTDIFEPQLLAKATKRFYYEPNTSVLINNGTSGFELRHLPWQAQVSPVYGIELFDVDGDNVDDIIMGGNLFAVKPEVGRYDAMNGLILRNDGKGNFKPLSALESGITVKDETRYITSMNNKGKKLIAFVRNNNSIVFYQTVK
jgi:hypothetical protein